MSDSRRQRQASFAAIFCLAALALGSSTGLRAAAADEPSAAAIEERARAHFGAGEFALAGDDFALAFDLGGKTSLLFNAGLAYERAGAIERAVLFYDKFLAVESSGGKVPEARVRRATLAAEIATQPQPKAEEPTAELPAAAAPTSAAAQPENGVSETPPEPIGSSERKRWAIGLGITGLLGLGAGTVLGLHARGLRDEALDAQIGACDADFAFCNERGVELYRDAKRSALLSTAGFGLGLAASAVGVYLWMSADSAERTPSTAIRVSPLGGDGVVGVLASGGF